MLLIGSWALNRLGLRSPDGIRDRDFIGTDEEIQNFVRNQDHQVFFPFQEGKKYYSRREAINNRYTVHYEYEIAWSGTTARTLLDLVKDDCIDLAIGCSDIKVPSLNVLYTIKMSHRYLRNSPHFLKTMSDIQEMRRLGAIIPDKYKEWFKAREKETYNYSHPNLNQSKQNFFDASVKYVYDHDSIHRTVARGEQPAYEYFKDDLAEVKVSRSKWDALPHQTKLNSVCEEATVLALERSQVPFAGKADPFWSYRTALIKVCSSITSGWWREFAWEHFDEVINMYDSSYVTKFWKAVEEGKVIKL